MNNKAIGSWKNFNDAISYLTRWLPLTRWVISSINVHRQVPLTSRPYTRHSVHVTQPYTGNTADNQLAPRQSPTCGWHAGKNWSGSGHVKHKTWVWQTDRQTKWTELLRQYCTLRVHSFALQMHSEKKHVTTCICFAQCHKIFLWPDLSLHRQQCSSTGQNVTDRTSMHVKICECIVDSLATRGDTQIHFNWLINGISNRNKQKRDNIDYCNTLASLIIIQLSLCC